MAQKYTSKNGTGGNIFKSALATKEAMQLFPLLLEEMHGALRFVFS